MLQPRRTRMLAVITIAAVIGGLLGPSAAHADTPAASITLSVTPAATQVLPISPVQSTVVPPPVGVGDILVECKRDKEWHRNRLSACQSFDVPFEIRSGSRLALIGGGILGMTRLEYTSPTANILDWAEQDTIVPRSLWGAGLDAVYDVTMTCTGFCHQVGEEGILHPTPTAAPYLNGTFYFTTSVAPVDDRMTGYPVMTIRISAPGSTIGWITRDDADIVRCDTYRTLIGTTGCIFPQYTPTAYWYTAGPPIAEVAQHIKDAQAIPGMPGAPGSLPLTRLTGPWKDTNRAVACPSSFPKGPGQSCDEYPFASTYQGAATGTNPTSSRAVDATQNSLHGSLLNVFYVRNRILDGDAFWVAIDATLPPPFFSGTDGGPGSSGSIVDLLADYNDSTLHWYPGKGDGTFWSERPLGNANFALMTLGRIDGDATPDLMALYTDGTLHWYPGKGDGSFWSARDLGPAGFRSVALADVNSDGKSDMVAVYNDYTLHWYPGKGDGTFWSARDLGPASFRLMAMADLNGDGKADLLAVYTDGTLHWYPGNGDGTYLSARDLGPANFALMTLGDLTNDGKADLLAVYTDGTLHWYPGNGDGTFGWARDLGPAGFSSMALGNIG